MAIVYRLAASAQEDVQAIAEWSLAHFGETAMRRYLDLLNTAFVAISSQSDVLRVAKPYSIANRTIYLYHLRHSKFQASKGGYIVKQPRHFIAFEMESEIVVIHRILHDAMDLPKSIRRLLA